MGWEPGLGWVHDKEQVALSAWVARVSACLWHG